MRDGGKTDANSAITHVHNTSCKRVVFTAHVLWTCAKAHRVNWALHWDDNQTTNDAGGCVTIGTASLLWSVRDCAEKKQFFCETYQECKDVLCNYSDMKQLVKCFEKVKEIDNVKLISRWTFIIYHNNCEDEEDIQM